MTRPRPHNLPAPYASEVLLALLTLLAGPLPHRQIAAGVAGDWSVYLGARELLGATPGRPPGRYVSETRQSFLTITRADDSEGAWRVDVRRGEGYWPETLSLQVRRTGAGQGSGTLREGTEFVPVEREDHTFLYGSGSRSNIPLQLRLTGLTASLPAGTYTTAIIYTVVDLQ